MLECCVGEGNGTPLQYSCLENPMDGGAWKAAVHGVAEGWTRLSDLTFTFHFHALEKEMATHSGVLTWRIPGAGEPGVLMPMGSHRVRHDWSDLAAAVKCCVHFWCTAKWFCCTYVIFIFFRFSPHTGYHRILGRVPCVTQSVLVDIYFIYSSVCMLIPNS